MLDSDTLWREAIAFGNLTGHCRRSQAWHDEEPCETCQDFVNFARRILRLAGGTVGTKDAGRGKGRRIRKR